MDVFDWQSEMPVPADELSAWHVRPGSFERLRPPWQTVRVLERSGGLEAGGWLVMSVDIGPIRRRWTAEIRTYEPGRRLVDVQVDGPFASWEHTHTFVPSGAFSVLKDHVDYQLPLGRTGDLVAGAPIEHALRRLFRFRHRRTRDDLARHAAYAGRPRLTVAVSGASGLIGNELTAFLASGGHRVLKLVRRRPLTPDEIFWDPERCALDPEQLIGVDAVVHLAGASLNQRWTPAAKRAILSSRVDGTTLIARTVAQLHPAPLLLSASAIGFYGDRGAETVDEGSPQGSGFLPDVVRAWEDALEPARAAGVRVVVMRNGLVLSGRGGALARMLPGYKYGAASTVGGGGQWMSWIALEDYLGVVLELLYDPSAEGVINAVSPNPVTNRQFTRTLSHVLRRPSLVPLPRRAVHLAFGEMGERLLLDSTRVLPTRLTARGFAFRYPGLAEALRAELGLFRS
jgi:uncharacterized protein (TIGR01777 family)